MPCFEQSNALISASAAASRANPGAVYILHLSRTHPRDSLSPQVRCVILDRFTRPASAPYDSRYNADMITYNPPILALLTVGGLSSSSSSIGVDGFRVSLVDDSSSSAAPSNRAYDSGGSLGTIAGAGAGAEAGKCLVDAADVGVEGGGQRIAFSVAACAELHVAFDADFTEEWLPVTLHMMQLDLASSFTSSCVSFCQNL